MRRLSLDYDCPGYFFVAFAARAIYAFIPHDRIPGVLQFFFYFQFAITPPLSRHLLAFLSEIYAYPSEYARVRYCPPSVFTQTWNLERVRNPESRVRPVLQ
ncbi:hypothetical protein GALMADRAFT_436424 [Galerina marginata CBS 339.88]|uniref:Uncharacterized protein n=1 Tax=Galerina marginata (strain CBS 339.88) TaxID=685588 RepID=A0A067T209_GALM3|nr:hypothetical protein GALMADRAFT_436424 [Galerina marginata CBS 339.88]